MCNLFFYYYASIGQPPPDGCNDLYCTECSEGYLKLITSPMGNMTCVKQCPVGYSPSANSCFGKHIIFFLLKEIWEEKSLKFS